MRRNTRWSVAFLVLGVILVSGALAASFQEVVGRIVPQGDPVAEYGAVTSDQARPGLAIDTQRRMLNVCYELPDSTYALTRPTNLREQLISRCAGLSADVIAISPTYSFAWLVSAKLKAILGDAAEFNRRLQRARITGPNELWVAEMRVVVAEAYFDQLDATNAAGQLTDIAMLGRSSSGGEFLARLYLTSEGARERIVSTVEGLAPEEQHHFLENVKWLAYSSD